MTLRQYLPNISPTVLARRITELVAGGLLCAGLCGQTIAAEQTQTQAGLDKEKTITYVVKAEDTLSNLAKQYLQSSSDMVIIQTINKIENPNLLPIGLELQLPRNLLKYKPAMARVTSANCELDLATDDQSKLVKVDSLITEGNIVDVPTGCAVDLRLEDGTLIRLPSSSAVKVTRLRTNVLETSPEVVLDLTKGRIDLNVQKPRSRGTPFEVRTPISVMGVRGTEFRVGVAPDNTARLEVLGGEVQMQGSSDTEGRALTAGQGVIINSSGHAGKTEALPGRPKLTQSFADTKSNSVKLQFATDPHSKQFALKTSPIANRVDEQTDRIIDSTTQLVHAGKEAVFLKIAGVTNNGLTGFDQAYAFCVPEDDATPQKCNLNFESLPADGIPISFRLVRVDENGETELLNTQSLKAKSGKFKLRGLKSGHYRWTLSYNGMQTDGKRQKVEQTADFDLLALSKQSPP